MTVGIPGGEPNSRGLKAKVAAASKCRRGQRIRAKGTEVYLHRPSLPSRKTLFQRTPFCNSHYFLLGYRRVTGYSYRPPRVLRAKEAEGENFFESMGTLWIAGALWGPATHTGPPSGGLSGKPEGPTYHVLLELKPPLSPLLVFLHAAVQVCKF